MPTSLSRFIFQARKKIAIFYTELIFACERLPSHILLKANELLIIYFMQV